MFSRIKRYIDQKTNLIGNNEVKFFGYEKLPFNFNFLYMNLLMNDIQGNSDIRNCDTYREDPIEGLIGGCDYVLSNPPFNVDGISVADVEVAGRLPFGLPDSSNQEIKNANFLWISYFYSYLNERGKAGFIMPSITMSGNIDKEIRRKIIETKHVDLLVHVPNKFFSSSFKGDCCLWFLNKQKNKEYENKILFIDASNYYSPCKENNQKNTWNEWQLKNLLSIIWLYRGQIERYQELIKEYREKLKDYANKFEISVEDENYLFSFQQKEELKGNYDFDNALTIAKEFHWIYSKFGEGKYKDIVGLCKVAEIEEVRENNYSLIPNIYVKTKNREIKS